MTVASVESVSTLLPARACLCSRSLMEERQGSFLMENTVWPRCCQKETVSQPPSKGNGQVLIGSQQPGPSAVLELQKKYAKDH